MNVPKKRNLSILATVAVLVGLLLPAAASAANPEWWVEGLKLAGFETVTTVSATPVTLEVPGVLAIVCQTETGTGVITAPSADSEHLKLLNCAVNNQPKCTVRSENEKAAGDITLNSATSAFLGGAGGATPFDRFAPNGGETLVVLVIEGGMCPIAGFYTVKGETAAQIPPLKNEAVRQPYVFSKAIAGAAGTVLRINGAEAFVSGTLVLELSGTRLGKVWGVR